MAARVAAWVAETASGVRVAVTGAAPSVFRIAEMEQALASNFAAEAIDGIAESRVGKLGTVRLEERQLGGRGRAFRLVVGAFEAGVGALIGVVEQVPVRPFEVEAQAERLPHAHVAELLPALIDRPCLHGWSQIGGKLALDDLAVEDRRKVVLGRPDSRGELLAEQDGALLERLECRLALAIELDPYRVEMIEAAMDPEILTPVVVHPVVFDGLARGDTADLVGAGTEQGPHRRTVERMRFDFGFRQHRKAGNGEHRLRRLVAVEGDP